MSRRPAPLRSALLAVALAGCTGSLSTPDAARADLPRVEQSTTEPPTSGRESGAADSGRTPDKPRLVDAADPCKGVTCSGHGQCKVSGGVASCTCDAYFKPGANLTCIDACTGVTCNQGYVCVPGAHEQTNPMCVETCDCSNCGNCSLSQIPSMGQAYCGSSSAPATVVCNKPCSNGAGCIPYSPGICWPMEGCISK